MAKTRNDSSDDLDKRFRALETNFTVAKTIAAVLGISMLGLYGWITYEKTEVASLQKQIVDMTPKVDQATALLKDTTQQQLSLIRSQATPIVHDLAQKELQPVSRQISDLQEDVFFLYYAEIVYGPQRTGDYHARVDNRKNFLETSGRYGRSKEQLESATINSPK